MLRVRGKWRLNKDCHILPSPAPSDIAVCLSRSPELLNRKLGGPALRWVLFSQQHPISNTSDRQLIWSPTHLISNSSDPQLPDFLSLLGLYNCFTSTQSLSITGQRNMQLPPSLEWHIWSSSSGNNCHAVHRPPSSGASVCDCTVGF